MISWKEYLEWQRQDKNIEKNKLIKLIKRDGYDSGLGKPESLRHDLMGLWSRRINGYFED